MTDALWMFSYGTLRDAAVQRAVFGRELAGVPDALVGFALDTIAIDDPDVVATSGESVHLILRRAADHEDPIAGVALAITPADLPGADAYEGASYVRLSVTLESGRTAFVYAAPQGNAAG